MNYYQQPPMYLGVGQPAMPTPYFPQAFPTPQMGMGQPGFMEPMMPQQMAQAPSEQSYIENILRLNIGKTATVYMNFEGSQWGSKIFKGTLLAAGKDHIILKDLNSELRYLLLSIYLDYITFDEEISYDYPFRKAK